MSDPAQAEHDAIRELDLLVHHLAEELAAFRRRALTAESKLKDVEAHEGGATALDLSARVTELEKENEHLRTKLEAATSRAKQMLERVRFLRQQAQGSGGDR
jgi:predicted RNase H-like nuclease (RuvC/YqgF family)